MRHRIFFAPGMFGFGRLASYDYFAHVERGLLRRFRDAGDEVEAWVADVPPTASIRRRAARLCELVSHTFHTDETPSRVHLVGHSTGGLDARLVASPHARLPVGDAARAWMPHLASVTTMNTPHFGTPLASFFATVSGQRVLYALSALTFIALSIGAPPLAIASALVVALGRVDRALGVELRVLDRATESLLRVLDDVRGREVRAYLDAIKGDQGAVLQLSPEAMDLFQTGVADRPGVLYQCVVTMAPAPTPVRYARSLLKPWSAISTSLFTTLYGLTARADERYPCAAPAIDEETERHLARALGRVPGVRANDGVVPILSQLWGRLAWAGHGDHLDVLGHFDGRDGDGAHVDWLTSGSGFDRARFEAMLDAVYEGMVAGGR